MIRLSRAGRFRVKLGHGRSLRFASRRPSRAEAIILAQQGEIARLTATGKAFDALVQALKIRIAKLRKQKFGPSSEKIEREIEQLQLALEDLEVAAAAADGSPTSEESAGASGEPAEPVRRQRGKPRIGDETPRERLVLDPGTACPDCGGPLRLLGEDVSAVLDFVAAKLKVTETARLKKSCRHCERIVQPPAPTRPIRRGMAGPARPYSGVEIRRSRPALPPTRDPGTAPIFRARR